VNRSRRLSALRARAERGSTAGERAAARRALEFEELRPANPEHDPAIPRADLEVGAVEPGVWPARDRDGRGTNYQVTAPDIGTAREWFRRGAMCILSAAGRRFVGKASGFSLPNSSSGPPALVYFVRWRDLPPPDANCGGA
jgi:hypothetical protein